MPPLPADKELLRLYAEGQCTNEQLALVHQYLHDPAYQESLHEWLQEDWQQVAAETYAPDEKAPADYQRFLKLVQPAPVKRMQWWKVAAAAMLLITTGLAGWQWQQQEKQRQLAQREQEWVYLHNEAGKRTEIMMPDSSQVYLNAASHLRYNKNYGITNRDIILEGEAYFIVKHGGQHPFSVHTGLLTTVDVGTAFNIRYRNNEPFIKVAVAEGAVNVINQQQRIVSLTRQQLLQFNISNRQTKLDTLPETALIGGWRQGILTFRQQRLAEIAKELEQYYGISIRFAKAETASMLITTTIPNVTATEALDIIAITAGVTVQRSGRDVLIK